MLARVLIVLSAGLLAACASSPGAKTTTAASTHAATPPPAPVPADPLALVASDTQGFVDVDLAAVAQAPDFRTWRAWTERFACVPAAQLDWLVQSSQRALIAVRGTEPKVEGLLILQGSYADTDSVRALSLLPQRNAPAMQAIAQTQHGRFNVASSGDVSAVVLDGRLLLVGHTIAVQHALASIEAPTLPKFTDTEPLRALRTRGGCAQRALCAAFLADSAAARALDRTLRKVGQKSLGKDVAASASAVSVDLQRGLSLATATLLADEATARSVEKQVNDWLWQLGVFARFAGFPEVLDEIKVARTPDNAIELHLALDAATLTKLGQRLEDVISGADSGCGGAGEGDATSTTEAAPVPAQPAP